jgi:hypothetical protein
MFDFLFARFKKGNCEWRLIKNHKLGDRFYSGCGCEFHKDSQYQYDNKCRHCRRTIEIIKE